MEENITFIKLPGYIHYNKTIPIDSCIVDHMKLLWANGVNTLGCCCGHNKFNSSIVIDSNYNDIDIEKIEKLLLSVDSRKWDIMQWKIFKVN